MMKFFGRQKEIAEFRKIRELSRRFARFTVLTGRRRVGKTQLLQVALDDGRMPYLHLVVTRKVEKVQCVAMTREAERVLGQYFGETDTFAQLFERLLREATNRPYTLVLDEFQEFDRVDPGIFGEVAAVWDRLHNEAHVNLVVCGSVNRLMNKIFFDDAEPLYGRNTGKIHLEPFGTDVLKEIFRSFSPKGKAEDLLALWTISGGVARYVELLMEAGAYTQKEMLRTVFSVSSSFLDEGMTILSEEFGKDYGAYFSILAAIAAGSTSHAQLKNELGMEIGGYLTKLERYHLISKKQPVYEPTGNKNCHYQIDDCFFRFWFRYVYRNQGLLELGRHAQVLADAETSFAAFSGLSLERYFWWKFVGETDYVSMGAWWDRKGENEIDLVCERPARTGKRPVLDFFEVKRDAKRIDLDALKRKAEAFFTKNPEHVGSSAHFAGLSMKDM